MGTVVPLPVKQTVDTTPSKRKAPTQVLGRVRAPPRRRPNKESRTREYLLPHEVEQLIKAARSAGRYGERDGALILIMFRHGLRVSEAINARWSSVDFKLGRLHITRLKRGLDEASHPLRGEELRALRALRRSWPETPYIFCSERGGPLKRSAVHKIVSRAGVEAQIGWPVHAHCLRHATGYYLANKGIDTKAIADYLGHRSLAHTSRYCQLAASRFDEFFND